MIDYSRLTTTPVERPIGIVSRFLRTVLWLFAGLGLLAVTLLIWVLPQVSPLVLLLAGSLGVLFLAMLSAPLVLFRRRRAGAVLGHILSAIRLRLPLPNYLRAAATGETPAMRRRLVRTAAKLESGSTLFAALKAEASELPPLELDRLGAAETNFTLEKTAADLLDHEKRRTDHADPGEASLAYFCVVAWCMVIVTAVLLLFVFPKYFRILRDFHQEIPAIIRVLASPGTEPMILAVAAIVTVLLLRLIAVATRGLFTSRPVPPVFRWLVDPLVWHFPLLGRLARARSSAAACEALAAALAVGRPAPEAIAIANMRSLNGVLRRRMARWHWRVTEGETLAAAARASHMPRLLTELLAGAHSDSAGAAAFAGRAYAATSERDVLILRAVTPLCLTAFFATGTTVLALAMFQPMVTLIDSMTSKGVP